MLTRRQLIGRGALGGVAMVCSPYDLRTTSEGSRVSTAADAAPFQRDLVIPPVLAPVRRDHQTDYYMVTMRKAKQQVLTEGPQTEVWGYNGIWPGPTIVARRGRQIKINQSNQLDVQTAVHMHGGNVAAVDDGHPMDLIDRGGSREYTYPNSQYAATHWYHDHANMTTARNVFMGLSGFYLIEDPLENELNLPRGQFDVPLMLQDRKFNDDGSFKFSTSDFIPVGDVMIVNGRQQPNFKVLRRKYRFRMLNASAARDYQLELSSGQDFVLVGNDGGLLPGPVKQKSFPITQAERVDVVIDFSENDIGDKVVLKHTGTPTQDYELMQFEVVGNAADNSEVPDTLRPHKALPAEVETREFRLNFDAVRQQWVINGQPYHPGQPGQIPVRPRLGTTELWRIVNDTPPPIQHAFHTHLARFEVVSRNGTPVDPNGREGGLKDTVAIDGAETVEIRPYFGDFTGIFVFHCHNLVHEDNAMMAEMEVVP